MWTLFRRREVKYKEYDRLLVMYRIMQDPDDFKEETGCCGLKWPLLVKIKNMFCASRCPPGRSVLLRMLDELFVLLRQEPILQLSACIQGFCSLS